MSDDCRIICQNIPGGTDYGVYFECFEEFFGGLKIFQIAAGKGK